jgi:uncharacterized protein (TIGR03083 family)
VEDRTLLARQERAELVELLEQLTPQQWDHETLCRGWRVRDVVAHLFSYEDLSLPDLGRRFVQGRFSLNRINAICLAEHAQKSPAQLTALASRCLQPRGLTAGFNGAIALVDGMIHNQDIRRPLNLPRIIPPERLKSALDFAKTAPTIRGFWHRRGLRMIATDLDWAVGSGPEVSGTGEALLMAIAGRQATIDELAGPGQPLLRRRLSRGQ